MTIIREPTSTPYESLGEGEDSAFGVSTCWSLAIKNVQQSDSGSYMCHVKPQANRRAVVNFTIEFLVKGTLHTDTCARKIVPANIYRYSMYSN